MSQYTKSIYQSLAAEMQKRHFPQVTPEMIADLHHGRTKASERGALWEYYARQLVQETLEQGRLRRIH